MNHKSLYIHMFLCPSHRLEAKNIKSHTLLPGNENCEENIPKNDLDAPGSGESKKLRISVQSMPIRSKRCAKDYIVKVRV